MADSGFVSADIGKIAEFERDSADAIKEFAMDTNRIFVNNY